MCSSFFCLPEYLRELGIMLDYPYYTAKMPYGVNNL